MNVRVLDEGIIMHKNLHTVLKDLTDCLVLMWMNINKCLCDGLL